MLRLTGTNFNIMLWVCIIPFQLILFSYVVFGPFSTRIFISGIFFGSRELSCIHTYMLSTRRIHFFHLHLYNWLAIVFQFLSHSSSHLCTVFPFLCLFLFISLVEIPSFSQNTLISWHNYLYFINFSLMGIFGQSFTLVTWSWGHVSLCVRGSMW